MPHTTTHLKQLNTESIIIPETNTAHIISKAEDIFSYIDSDFENWKLEEKPYGTTSEKNLNIYEQEQDGTFAQIFTDPQNQCLTQSQIIEFCRSHRDWLRKNNFATFFLIKENDKYFVVDVLVSSGAALYAYVNHLDDDFVWAAEYRHRVVIPQLQLSLLNL